MCSTFFLVKLISVLETAILLWLLMCCMVIVMVLFLGVVRRVLPSRLVKIWRIWFVSVWMGSDVLASMISRMCVLSYCGVSWVVARLVRSASFVLTGCKFSRFFLVCDRLDRLLAK